MCEGEKLDNGFTEGDEEFSNSSINQVDPGIPALLTWQRKLNGEGNTPVSFSISLKEVIHLAPIGFRLWRHVQEEAAKGRGALMNPFSKRHVTSNHGVPLGGIGLESFPTASCRLLFRVLTVKSILLSCAQGARRLSSEPDPKLRIVCRQISPFIPHNYKESSFPVSVFTFTLYNSGQTAADVTLLFTWANSVGGLSEFSGHHSNSKTGVKDRVHGVLLHHKQVPLLN
ncbi:hypothetical protein L484_010957 [Morus notabilis]|uniref:Glycosyl-hydrolase family 116 N-terminal domain-containing protein n=1 Tax=Morus notabilis TaxID=981085 RepID=W9RLC0_9ROSA|nr:hypothetical protein L484_010957 [Morus notabilis]